MAVKMSMDTTEFMEALFGADHPTIQQFKMLEAHGAKPEIGFYSVAFGHQGGHLTVNLPVSTSTLLKGNGSSVATATCRTMVAQLIEQCLDTWFSGPDQHEQPASKPKKQAVPSEVSNDTVQSVANALGLGEQDMNSLGLGTTGTPTKPLAAKSSVNISDVAKLHEAKFLGQKTRGTSPGSIYRCIAISSRLNVAARINYPSAVSIRAEGLPNQFEVAKLKALGFSLSGTLQSGHWSLHLDTAGLTPARVIGAVLMDMGVPFDLQIKTLKEAQLEG